MPSDGTGGFHALTSERIVDSPAGLGVAGPTITAGTSYDIQVTGDTVPAGATAIFANIKLSSATVAGGLRVAKNGTSLTGLPSALNFDAGVTTDSGITIPLSSSGKIRIASTAPSGTVKIYIDVQGYFAPGDGGAEFHVGSQQLLVDNLTVAGGADKTITAAGSGGLPADGSVGSVALTLFVSNWSASGGVSVANPDDGPSDLSNVSFATSMDEGTGVNSTAIIPASEQGKLVIRNKSANSVKVRLTVQGWFEDSEPGLPAMTSYGVDEAELEDLQVIAANHGISLQQAVDRYGWQDELAETLEDMAATFPTDYASSTLKVSGSPGATIRFKGPVPNGAAAMVSGLPGQIDLVGGETYSESDIESLVSTASDTLIDGIGSDDVFARFDFEAESVRAVVNLPSTLRATSATEESLEDLVLDAFDSALPSIPAPAVEVTIDNAPTGEMHTIRGGANIESSTYLCTTGFTAKDTDGDTGIVTADHCPDNLQLYGTDLRTAFYNAARKLSKSKGDLEWHQSRGESTEASFYYKVGAKRAVTKVIPPSIEDGNYCAFGRGSDDRDCGPVARGTFSHKGYNKLIAVSDVTMSDGDSGGPLYYGTKAVGIDHGGAVVDGHPVELFTRLHSNLSGTGLSIRVRN